MIRYLLLVVLVLSSWSCGGSKLTRRYKSFVSQPVPKPSDEWVAVEGVALEVKAKAEPEEPAVLQLGERAQAELVRVLSDEQDILKALSKPFPKPPKKSAGSGPVLPPQVFKRRLILTTSLTKANSADRIARLKLRLDANAWGNRAELVGWNRFDTTFGSVDLGKVTDSRTRTFNAKLSPTFSGSLVGMGEIGGGSEVIRAEELVLKERIIELSGFLQANEATVLQEGGIGLDLEGNVSLDLEVAVNEVIVKTVVHAKGLKDSNGHWGDPGDAKLTFAPTRFYPGVDELAIRLSAHYGFRHVTKGESTIIEGDDEVVYYEGETEGKRVVIVPSSALPKTFFTICDSAGNGLHALPPADASPRLLRFASLVEARDFLMFLHEKQAQSMDGATLMIDGRDLQLGDLGDLEPFEDDA